MNETSDTVQQSSVTHSTTGGSKRDWHKTVPYWFAAAAGMVYATGFLVEFTFFNSLGIKDAGGDAFKAKYMYIGILCLLLPVATAVTSFGIRRMNKDVQRSSSPARASAPAVLSMLNFFFTFYVIIAFAPSDFFQSHQPHIFWFFVLVFFGLILLVCLEEQTSRFIKKFPDAAVLLPRQRFWSLLRWTLFNMSMALMIWMFWDLWPMLFVILQEGGYLYLGLIAVILLLVWRVAVRLDEPDYPPAAKVAVISAATCSGVFIAYLAILVFAGRIYCYIPARKGGGDYSAEKTCTLSFDSRLVGSIPTNLLNTAQGPLISKPVYILRETDGNLYVCIEDPKQPPSMWREPGLENKPRQILNLRKDAVVSIVENEW